MLLYKKKVTYLVEERKHNLSFDLTLKHKCVKWVNGRNHKYKMIKVPYFLRRASPSIYHYKSCKLVPPKLKYALIIYVND